MSDKAKIIYTITDEAPALATHSLLPIIEATPLLLASPSRRATSHSQVVSLQISQNFYQRIKR